MNTSNSSNLTTRREFLQKSSVAMAGAGLAATLPFPNVSHGAAGFSEHLKIGLIGCGARGTGAMAQALTADSNSEMWAMGDVFPEAITRSQEEMKKLFEKEPGRVNVPQERKFVGLDAYKKVLASGVDFVVLATPGGFRPMTLRAAAEAGKHIFCEKPMGVDPAGVRSVMESVKLIKEKKLALRAGFSMRFESPYREAIKRIHDGAIGDLVSIYSTRMSNRLSRFSGERKLEWNDLEWQLRNWHHFSWLSGDYIMEVSVHSVDKIAWAMRDVPPIKCSASGARQQQTLGDIWDQFDITYEWENGVIAVLKTRYQDGCYNEHRDVFVGTKGRCIFDRGTAWITGATNWKFEGTKPVSHQVEHDELFAEFRAGKLTDDGDRMAKSTLMGIMGRMAAYTGKEVTWQMALESKLDTMPRNLSWDMKLEVPPAPVAGKTKLI